jgi:peptidoglycan/LPS O-acetylase OafA/YrhL
MATAAGANSNPRYRSLDSYRFIAAGLVVLLHYHEEFALKLGAVTPIVTKLEVMVDFFFVLSGFVIAVTYGKAMANAGDYARFLQRRVARLLPLHVAVLTVFIGLAAANKFGWMTANHTDILDFHALPANILMLHAWGFVDHLSFNAASWSISAEWLAYVLFPVLLIVSRRFTLATNLAIVIGIVAVLTLWRDAMGMRAWYEASFDYGALRAVPSFFLGIVIAGVVEMSSRTSRTLFQIPFQVPWLAVHMTFLAALASLYFDLRDVTIALLALVVFLAAIAERGNTPSVVTSRLMGRLGDAAYAIYTIHGVAAIPFVFVLRKFGALGTPVATGIAIALYLASVAAACFIYVHFETPMRRRISAIGTRTAEPGTSAPGLTLKAAR